ncbi:unnamed protein product [Dicrocoelium dendriticum]|nr:unnamed protein product [Dicrocoelium dendriticum]
MCAVRLAGSFKSSKSRGTNRCLFVIAAYAPTNCSDDSVKDDFYRQLNELPRHRRSSDTVVLSRDLNAQVGKLSTDGLHLDGQHGIGSRTDNDFSPTTDRPSPWAVPLDPPSRSEAEHEIGPLKLNKAAGPDDLPPALFKFGGPALVDGLHELLVRLWEQETVPTDWSRSVIVTIFKGASRSECGSHRGISLISIASKLLASVILRRLTGTREIQIRQEQAGFRRGRGCIDHIFTLRQLLEHRHIYWRPTVVVFFDIKCAFDSVERHALWGCLLRKGVPEKYVNIIRALYARSSGRVRAYGKLSSPFNISSGVRQGFPLSPFLFNFAIDEVIEIAFTGHDLEGVDLLPGE